jgi:hypothetical protein
VVDLREWILGASLAETGDTPDAVVRCSCGRSGWCSKEEMHYGIKLRCACIQPSENRFERLIVILVVSFSFYLFCCHVQLFHLPAVTTSAFVPPQLLQRRSVART